MKHKWRSKRPPLKEHYIEIYFIKSNNTLWTSASVLDESFATFSTNINNPLDTSFFEYTGDDRLKRVKDIKLFTELLKKYKEEKVDCLE